jgi:hypothetical protein
MPPPVDAINVGIRHQSIIPHRRRPAPIPPNQGPGLLLVVALAKVASS